MKKTKRKISVKHYKTLEEIPVYNWFKIHETNDISYMLTNGPKKVNKQFRIVLLLAFQKMRDEFIDVFGLSDRTKELMKLKAQLQVRKIDLALTQDRIHKTFINVLEKQIKEIEGDVNKTVDFWADKVHVDKFMHQRINLKDISAREYFSILKEMVKQAPKPKPVRDGKR